MRTLRLAVFIFAVPACFAQGFLYDAFDARGLAMAGSPFAAATGAGALTFNPASVALRQGLFMNVGGSLNMRQASFAGTTGGSTPQAFSYETDNGIGGIPQVSFSYAPSSYPFGFGVAVTEPFQLNTVWPSTWPGAGTVERVDVHAIYSTIAAGFRVNRLVAVGADVHVVSAGFSTQSVRSQFVTTGPTYLTDEISDGAGSSAAVGASIIISPSPQFSFAAGYTSGANVPVKGRTENLGLSPSSRYREVSFHSLISLPSVLEFGLDVRPTSRLRFDAAVSFVGWAGFYGLRLDYDDSTARAKNLSMTFRNSAALRAGMEFAVTPGFALRAGVGYSSSAIEDDAAPWFPDAGAFHYAFGLGYQFTKNIRFDLGYRGTSLGTRTGTPSSGFNGTYAPTQHLLAASIALAFEPVANPLGASAPAAPRRK